VTTARAVQGTARSCWNVLLLVALLSPVTAHAQFKGVRFEITQVGDSTFKFPRGTAKWVSVCANPSSSCPVGSTGIAVDPRRHDVLVARFRVARIDSGLVTAVVTGQTTRVATEHIAVMTEPAKPWWKGITFWGGTVFGMVLGALISGA
jgi:hypothetical protein